MTVSSHVTIPSDTSSNVAKTLLLAAVSCVLYVRCLLPEIHFIPVSLGQLYIKVIRNDSCEAGSLIHGMLQHGVYDALDHKFVRKLTLAIITSPDKRSESLESYHFNFSYSLSDTPDDPPDITAHLDQKINNDNTNTSQLLSSFNLKSKLNQRSLHVQIHRFMRTLVLALQTLQSLPGDCYIDMHMQYTDDTPIDYQPMFFRPSNFVPAILLPVQFSTGIPCLQTQFHTIHLDLESSALPIVDQEGVSQTQHPIRSSSTQPLASPAPDISQITPPKQPNDNVQSMNPSCLTGMPGSSVDNVQPLKNLPISPPESQRDDTGPVLTQERILTANSCASHISTSPIDSDRVDCACSINDPDCGMLQCDECLTWQHVVCFGYVHTKDKRVPDRFLCHKCDPSIPESVYSSLRDIARFRSAISIIWNESPSTSGKKIASQSFTKSEKTNQVHIWSDSQLATRMEIDVNEVRSLMKRAVYESIVQWVKPQTTKKVGRKPSRLTVEVLKQSNEARRTLHLLFDPTLMSLPSGPLLLAVRDWQKSKGVTRSQRATESQAVTSQDLNPTPPSEPTYSQTQSDSASTYRPSQDHLNERPSVANGHGIQTQSPSQMTLISQTQTKEGIIDSSIPGAIINEGTSISSMWLMSSNRPNPAGVKPQDQSTVPHQYPYPPSSGSLEWLPDSQTQPLTDSCLSNLVFAQSPNGHDPHRLDWGHTVVGTNSLSDKRSFMLDKGSDNHDDSDTLSEADDDGDDCIPNVSKVARDKGDGHGSISNKHHSLRHTHSSSSVKSIVYRSKKRKRPTVVQTPDEASSQSGPVAVKLTKLSAAETLARIPMM